VMARDVEPYATTTAIPYIILLLLLPSDPSSVNTSPLALDDISRCAILRWSLPLQFDPESGCCVDETRLLNHTPTHTMTMADGTPRRPPLLPDDARCSAPVLCNVLSCSGEIKESMSNPETCRDGPPKSEESEIYDLSEKKENFRLFVLHEHIQRQFLCRTKVP